MQLQLSAAESQRAQYALYVSLVANSFALASVFPYAGFMVKNGFHMVEDDREVGFFAGFVMGSFMFGRTVTSCFLGQLSDRWGRLPVIYMGLLALIFFQLCFGFSTNFTMALASRFFMGAFNGIIAVAKTMIAELVPPDKAPGAMSGVAGTWGIGMILGTAMGGALAEPADRFASISADSVLGQYPYALPNLVSSFIACIAIVAVRMHLPETLPKQHRRSPLHRCCTWRKQRSKSRAGVVRGQSRSASAAQRRDRSGQQLGLPKALVHNPIGASSSRYARVGIETSTDDAQADADADADVGVLVSAGKGKGTREDFDAGGARPWNLCSGQVRVSISAYCLLSLNSIMFNEIMVRLFIGSSPIPFRVAHGGMDCEFSKMPLTDAPPSSPLTNAPRSSLPNTPLVHVLLHRRGSQPLWCLAPVESGGLAVGTGTIGAVGAATGVALALYQFCVFSRISRQFALVDIFRCSAYMCTPLFLVFPAVARAKSHTARLIFLVCVNSAVQLIQSSMFTANFSIINNSVVTAQRGSVNGLAMGIASFFKATGPMAGTALFAWSLTNGLPSPLDVHFCYVLMCGIAMFTALLARQIPASLSSPLPEPDHVELVARTPESTGTV